MAKKDRQTNRQRDRAGVCVFERERMVCVFEREREKEMVCVFERERERERE